MRNHSALELTSYARFRFVDIVGMDRQRTLRGTAVVEGVGYWSGQRVRVEFRPAAVDSGVAFVRSDLHPAARIPVRIHERRDVPRRTVLGSPARGVEMVEHVLAALAGLQVDNCEIHVTAGELPGLDGSSQPFVEALDAAGFVEQSTAPRTLCVSQVVRFGDDEGWIEARPARDGELHLEYQLDYGSESPIPRQSIELTLTPAVFREQLGASRTFLLLQEADWLRSQGLGQNTAWHDLLIFGPQGPIDNTLRWPNECARHKALDLLGDLALAGRRISGRFVAYRSGHRHNAELVRALLADAPQSAAA